jgi:hypothetical protein
MSIRGQDYDLVAKHDHKRDLKRIRIQSKIFYQNPHTSLLLSLPKTLLLPHPPPLLSQLLVLHHTTHLLHNLS